MMDWCTVGEDCVAEQFTHFRHDEEKLVERRGKMSFPFGGSKWNGRKEKMFGRVPCPLCYYSRSQTISGASDEENWFVLVLQY